MNITRRTAAGFLASIIAAASIAPAGAQTLDEIKARGSINIGMLVDFPPFGIMNAQNQPDGYDADVAKALANHLGVRANIVPVSAPNRIPYLLSGQIQILVASLGITAERAERVAFSAPYAGIRVAVFGLASLDMSAPEKLAGRTIGVVRATTEDRALAAIAPSGAVIRRFDDGASLVQALLSGQVEGIAGSTTFFIQVERAAPGRFKIALPLAQNQAQGIAIRPGSGALLEAINAFLVKAKADGTLDGISQKWMAAPLPEFVKTAN
jgi:polar amino acid transport system substrate-binding protein